MTPETWPVRIKIPSEWVRFYSIVLLHGNWRIRSPIKYIWQGGMALGNNKTALDQRRVTYAEYMEQGPARIAKKFAAQFGLTASTRQKRSRTPWSLILYSTNERPYMFVIGSKKSTDDSALSDSTQWSVFDMNITRTIDLIIWSHYPIRLTDHWVLLCEERYGPMRRRHKLYMSWNRLCALHTMRIPKVQWNVHKF